MRQSGLAIAAPDSAIIADERLAWRCPCESCCYGIRVEVVWPDVDEVAPCPLWEDAREAGLSVGIAQSSWAARGAFGLLSIARHADRLTPAEINMLTLQTHWLANLSHSLMSGLMVPKLAPAASVVLTAREREVLCWTAEGKTAFESVIPDARPVQASVLFKQIIPTSYSARNRHSAQQ